MKFTAKAKRLLHNKGEMYIDTIISVFVIMIFLALVMTFLPVFMQKYQLDMAAEDIARGISVSGRIVALDADLLSQEYDIVIDSAQVVPAAGARMMTATSGGGQYIQLSDGFSVVLTSHRTVGIGGLVAPANLEISSTAKGRSEVYWKELAATP